VEWSDWSDILLHIRADAHTQVFRTTSRTLENRYQLVVHGTVINTDPHCQLFKINLAMVTAIVSLTVDVQAEFVFDQCADGAVSRAVFHFRFP
jgi:hypothetical protein